SSCRACMGSDGKNRIFRSFVGRVRSLDSTRKRVDDLVSSGHLTRRAAEQMYESLFLSSFTAFEVFIEDVFLAYLVKPRPARKAVPRVRINSLAVAREMVIGPGRKYVDWFPFGRTIERADI